MTLRFSTILAAVALMAAAVILVVLVGMYRGSPGDAAYASDPGGTPIPLDNPRIPRTDIAAPGPLTMLLEEGGAYQASSIAVSSKSARSVTPHLRFGDEKRFMLGLINAERRKAGVPEVSLGDNNAAQIQVENAIRDCVSGHWGTDGLGPPMRYSLAGGYQSNAENASGHNYCLSREEKPRYRAIQSVQEAIRRTMSGYMNSPGHRDSILFPWHRKVNLGLSWDTHQMWNVQHFEGDYVDCSVPPTIQGTTLSMTCTTNEVLPAMRLAQMVVYDSPPHTLTRGQIARSYSYGYGRPVAYLRQEARPGYRYLTNEASETFRSGCTPYDFDPALPPPSSPDDDSRIHEESKLCVLSEETVTVPWVDGEETISGSSITLSHDLSQVIGEHGNGVYTLVVWGCSVPDSIGNPCADDNAMVIIEEAIFYGIDPPDTYSPDTSSPTPTPTPTPTATGQPVDCGSAVADRSNTGLVSDCEALLAARDTLRGTAALNWAPNTSIATWHGITLGGSPQRVTKVKLHRKGLNGRIAVEIGRLKMLQELWLYVNELTGTIPAEIGDLSNLTGLFVSDNNLSGQIPETLNNLTLDRLWLHGNNFTGCVPYNLTLTREYKVDRGLPACAQPTGGATPTPTPMAGTPTPTPTPDPAAPTPTPTSVPIALDSRITWQIHCQADDFVAAFGEEYVMDDERTWHTVYDRNGRGLWHVLRTVWRSPSNTDRSVACMTKVYDNAGSAFFDDQFTMMLEEALGGSDVLRQHKRCCKEIGDRFRGLVLDIGSTFSDGTWQDTLTARSGVASFLRGQVIVRIASYDRGDGGGYHLLQIDEMARRVNSRFYEGIFDEIETRRMNYRAGAQASPGRPVYLNPFSQGGE